MDTMQTIVPQQSAPSQTPDLQANTVFVEILLAFGHPENHRRITKRQVAAEAGVGLWTVTRAINNFPAMAPDTRRAVLETIARLTGRSVSELVLGRIAA